MSNGAKAWFPDFKAKEPMFHDGGRPHAEEVFTVPDRLFNGDVLFPTKVMGSFVKLVAGETGAPSEEMLDALNADYLRARGTETLIFEKDTPAVRFKTSFKTHSGQNIYAVIEPDYYDTKPNTWRISKFYCANAGEQWEGPV